MSTQDMGRIRALLKSRISGQVENVQSMLIGDKSILANRISYRDGSNLISNLGHSKTKLTHVFSGCFAIEAALFASSITGTKL
jgi:hypothetical protein